MRLKKLQFVILLFFICTSVLNAQISKSVSVTTSGTLKNLVSTTEANTVTALTVSGNLDARDFAFIRDNMKVVSILNLYAASIKSYTGTEGTNSGISTSYPANEIPMYAFYNPYLYTYKYTLTGITLPSTTVSIGYLAFYYAWNLSATLSIPASVKSISDYAFYGCSSLSTFAVASANTRYSSSNGVIFNKAQDTLFIFPQAKSGNYSIPSSVTHVAKSAFENCWNLAGITLPNSLRSIGSYAFCYCSGITGSLTLPSALQKIEDGAFYGCYNLTETVTIPASLTDIGSYCFFESNNIKSFVINSSNSKYASLNDVMYSKNMDTLFICPGGKTGPFTIPNSVKLIGSYAFYKCSKISGTMNIPALVDYIGYYAFFGCSLITDYMVSTSNVYFSSTDGVLLSKNNDRLLAYPVPKSGTYVLPATLKEIDPGAFAYCDYLSGCINIPENVIFIGEYAFYGTKLISGITVDNNNNFYSSDDGVLFNKYKDSLLICPYSKSGQYEIPSTVAHIGNFAFDGCLNLTEITIPSYTTSIGNYAFEYCTGITKIRIPRNLTNIGLGAFYNCSNLLELSTANPNPPVVDYYTFELINKSTCNLIVPTGAKTTYQNAPYWGDFSVINEYYFESALPAYLDNKYLILNKGFEVLIKGTNSEDIIEIYNINGFIVSRTHGNKDITHIKSPTKGVYIVKINDCVNKIIF